MRIPTCFIYNGHCIYEDGRVYRNYELVGHYKTVAAAKAAATRHWKQIISR